MLAVVSVFVVIGLLAQSPTLIEPIRVGPSGHRLTADDLAQISRLAAEGGARPWVIVGRGRVLAPTPLWYVDIFLTSASLPGGIRRGRAITVMSEPRAWDDFESPKTWRVMTRFDYAQVPVAGRDPAVVADSRDLGRPFPIIGTVSDDDLAAIVALVRRSPVFPRPQGVQPWEPLSPLVTDVQGTWPIARVTAESDGTVRVSLRHNIQESGGQIVKARRSGGRWILEMGGVQTHAE